MTMFARPTQPVAAAPPVSPAAPAPGKRPPAWSLRNWPVRWKVLAIALIPLILATTFGVLRVRAEWDSSDELRLAAARANMIPAITNYMSALDVALLASSTGRDVEGAKKNFAARKTELQMRLAETDVIADVRSGVDALLNDGQSLVDKVLADSIPLRERITTYAPLLLTAEDAINASVRADTEQIRAQVQGLSRAVGARGQMTMQEILVTRGAELPEPQLRSSMITLAGTEPSTLFGLNLLLGIGSPDTKTLQQQMVSRLAILSDPANELVDNPDLLRSIETTKGIAEQVITDNATPVTKSVQSQATARRDAATRDALLVLGAIAIALVAVLLVARTLVKPLRVLRDGALKVAHTDLAGEIEAVRGGADPVPAPLAVYTTEEIGQVAHAVDELHTQALQLAGDEARLRLLVNDMFETMSRRSRSLVDQQLKLIDGLERQEEDPERLESLFRLDHLAARLRRNSANLLVLAGAQITRDNREPVPLSTVLNAAVSEVEDYRRVEIADLPDCTVVGSAAGGVIHMLAELIDNALRYSPPTSQVRVSAVRGQDGGALLRVADSGLGMTESDRRIANMRLQAGGEVIPDNARHMGLFVVGRLASRHGIRVGLRGPAAGESGTGTTAEVYLPAAVLVGTAPHEPESGPESAPPKRAAGAFLVSPPRPADERGDQQAVAEPAANGAGTPVPPVTLLPRRTPGTSGITDVPAPPSKRPRRELPTPWWEKGSRQESKPGAGQPPKPAAAQPTSKPATQPAPKPTAQQAPQPARASDTSAFFARRSPAPAAQPEKPQEPEKPQQPEKSTPKPADPAGPVDDDVIYQRMLAEMMGDPHDLVESPDLDWKTVWDRGWSAAAAAEEQPVEAHTEHGLPVRNPGARLVPGSAESDADEVVVRDPEAVRASIGSHFGGVHTGRSQAGDTANGSERP